jgi:hypothetical protein
MQCMVPEDCPQPPPICDMCLNGATACYHATCDDGVCGIAIPECVDDIPCQDSVCGDPCTPAPSPDGVPTMYPTACDAAGRCVDASEPVDCSGQIPCMIDSDCPRPNMGECVLCDDGTTECKESVCVQGLCAAQGTTCPGRPACMVNADCPALPPECLPCGDSCGANLCVNGGCEVMCDFGRECETAMDCGQPPNNICTMGPWECLEQSCALRHQDC